MTTTSIRSTRDWRLPHWPEDVAAKPGAPDPRDGTMASINGPMPPAQADVFAMVPAVWQDMPRAGVSDMILRALKERGVVTTHWRTLNIRQWRRT